jgi:transcriptional regulator GlxA family with amidase domain
MAQRSSWKGIIWTYKSLSGRGFMPPDIRLLIMPLPDFALLPFGAFLDKLRFSADDEDYSQQRYCSWTVAGLSLEPVPSSSGAVLQVEAIADQLDLALSTTWWCSAVAVPWPPRRWRHVTRRCSGRPPRRSQAGGVDNGAFLLAACGLLQGHKVVVHWRHEAEFRAAFPQLQVLREQLYCIDGNRITCAGGTAAIDLAVALLSRAAGEPGRSRAGRHAGGRDPRQPSRLALAGAGCWSGAPGARRKH